MATGYTATLAELREGALVLELDDLLRRLVGDVRATGKGGKLTVTLAVKPLKNSAGHILTITDVVKVTPPAREEEATLLYATDDHSLTRRDPRQPELKFNGPKVLEMPATPEREAASE